MRRFTVAIRAGASGVEAARVAGYKGNENVLAVRASKLRANERVAAVLAGAVPTSEQTDAPSFPRPQEGPQTAFADCTADIGFFGGAGGGGKSWSLLFEPVKWGTLVDGAWRMPSGMRSLLLRRTQPEIVGGGGLWDEAGKMYMPLNGRARRSPNPDFIFHGDAGGEARVEFRHLTTEGDLLAHHGRQYAFIGFDEATHFTERQFWYLLSRLRSMCGVRPYVRATCNPDPDSFVAKLIAWWIGTDGYPIADRSGVLRWLVRVDDGLDWFDTREAALAAHPDSLPISFTFIGSRLTDNKVLMASDPSYIAKLKNLTRVDRARLLDGNWSVREQAGLFFKSADFKVTSSAPASIVRTVRAWDKAASKPTAKHPDPDWTRGVRIHQCDGGHYYVDDVVSAQDGPVEVLNLMRSTAEADGHGVEIVIWQDTAGAGKTDAEVTQRFLEGFTVHVVDSFSAPRTTASTPTTGASRAKREFAREWAPIVEQGRFHVRDGELTRLVIGECHLFPDGRHDDVVDAISAGMRTMLAGGMTLAESMKNWRW
jgi:phage terminase large subunit-like protein